MKKIVVMLVLAFALGLVGSAFAAETPFSSNELDMFLETFPGFKAKAEELGETMDGVEDPNAAQMMAVNEELTGFLKSNGWDSPQRFFYVLGHVGTGMSIIKMGGTGGMNSIFAQQKAQIEQMPIPEDQKKAALQALEQNMGHNQDNEDGLNTDVPPEEMDLIRQNQARIEKVLMSE